VKEPMPSKDFTPNQPAVPTASILAGAGILFGIAVFSYGFWLAWHPLGFIAAGASISAVSVLVGRNVVRRMRRFS